MTAVRGTETGIRQQYSVIVHYDAEDNIYDADVPTLGFVTQGDSYEDAFAMAEDAITGRLETLREHGQPIPVGVRLVTVQHPSQVTPSRQPDAWRVGRSQPGSLRHARVRR